MPQVYGRKPVKLSSFNEALPEALTNFNSNETIWTILNNVGFFITNNDDYKNETNECIFI